MVDHQREILVCGLCGDWLRIEDGGSVAMADHAPMEFDCALCGWHGVPVRIEAIPLHVLQGSPTAGRFVGSTWPNVVAILDRRLADAHRQINALGGRAPHEH